MEFNGQRSTQYADARSSGSRGPSDATGATSHHHYQQLQQQQQQQHDETDDADGNRMRRFVSA